MGEGPTRTGQKAKSRVRQYTDDSSFHAKPGTPTVNGLYTSITASGPTGPLLTNNLNGMNPARLTHSQALTCDQDHGYYAGTASRQRREDG